MGAVWVAPAKARTPLGFAGPTYAPSKNELLGGVVGGGGGGVVVGGGGGVVVVVGAGTVVVVVCTGGVVVVGVATVVVVVLPRCHLYEYDRADADGVVGIPTTTRATADVAAIPARAMRLSRRALVPTSEAWSLRIFPPRSRDARGRWK